MRPVITNLIVLVFISTIIFVSCRIKNEDDPDKIAPGTKEGYDLAKYHCGNCHGFMPASALDSTTWANIVLPNMALKMGIEVLWGKEYLNRGGNSSGILFRDWQKIVAYYTRSAPKKITLPPTGVKALADTSTFEVKQPARRYSTPVKTELAVIDPISKKIFTSDVSSPYLYQWNNKLEQTDSILLYSSAVSATFLDDAKKHRQGVFTMKGNDFVTSKVNGQLLQLDISSKLKKSMDTIAMHLPRPLQSVPADFNQDGLMDWATCATAEYRGGVFVSLQLPSGKYEKKLLSDSLGAIRLVTDDFNKDGWSDLLVLYAYNDESITLFLNDKKGAFTETKLFGFQALYGLTGLQLADFNKDGLNDIVYTCGSTYSLSGIPQPYHGVYIYLNKGSGKFEESWFYPLSGCVKAMAADIDADGKLDIATISIDPGTTKNSTHDFIWFRQIEPLKFEPRFIDLQKYGQWLTMDVNDYDGDGDADIILGNYFIDKRSDKITTPPGNATTPFTILENKKF